MDLTAQIPGHLARRLSLSGDLSRRAREALALEGYGAEALTEADIKRLLGLEMRMVSMGFSRVTARSFTKRSKDRDHDSAVTLDSVRRLQTQQQNEPRNLS